VKKRILLGRTSIRLEWAVKLLVLSAFLTGFAAITSACGPGYADYTEPLGDDLLFVRAGSLDRYILRGSEFIVGNVVLDFDYDAEWVIALRVVANVFECEPHGSLEYGLSGEVEYWIIDQKANDTIGPLTKSEFDQRVRDMRIPLSLTAGQSEVAQLVEIARKTWRTPEELARSCERLPADQV
jgi:hypothetical protein